MDTHGHQLCMDRLLNMEVPVSLIQWCTITWLEITLTLTLANASRGRDWDGLAHRRQSGFIHRLALSASPSPLEGEGH